MGETVLLSIVIVIALGIFSQWVAWRIQWPSIVIMSIAGLLMGPILGIINPEQALGELYTPLISLAVAIILFEGSASLDIREVKGISKSVFRIVTLGAFLAWIAGSFAAHFIAGLSLEISFIIGGLFVVTGPTVIIPLLRQAKLKPRTAAVLKWEGIIVDPAGPLLALFAYEVIKVFSNETIQLGYLSSFLFGAMVTGVVGYVIGIVLSVMVSRGRIPDYLHSPMILSFVLLCFSISEVIMHETGMLAVTVMGLTMGHTKKYVSSIKKVGHFVEDISVLLTSTVFILLTASLPREIIGEIFTLPIISFVLVMLFIVRPLSIWVSTIGTELTVKEKTLISWIAPRGIVALTVSGYFASLLLDDGYQDASILTALTFALVFITVCAHGFSLGPLSKKLGLANTEPPGILIVGSNLFSIGLAEHCQKLGIPVLIVDHSFENLRLARERNIDTYYGEILSDDTRFEIDLTPYESILVMTDEGAYNALVCQSYVDEFGFNHTFALLVNENQTSHQQKVPSSMKASLLFGEGFETLNKKMHEGHTFSTVDSDVDQRKIVQKEELNVVGIPLFIRKKDGSITFITLRKKVGLDKGDQIVVLSKYNEENSLAIPTLEES